MFKARSRAKRTWRQWAWHLSRLLPSVVKLQSSVQIGRLRHHLSPQQKVEARFTLQRQAWNIQMLRHNGEQLRGDASVLCSWSSFRRPSRWDRFHLGLMVLSRAVHRCMGCNRKDEFPIYNELLAMVMTWVITPDEFMTGGSEVWESGTKPCTYG